MTTYAVRFIRPFGLLATTRVTGAVALNDLLRDLVGMNAGIISVTPVSAA